MTTITKVPGNFKQAFEIAAREAALSERGYRFVRLDAGRPVTPPPPSRRHLVSGVPSRSGGGGVTAGVEGVEPYASAAARLLRGSGCAVRAWTRGPSAPAFAYTGRRIDAPRPMTAAALAVLSHEVMHHYDRPGDDLVKREVDSWRMVLSWWDAEGLPNRRQAVQTACSRLRTYDPTMGTARAVRLLEMAPGSTLALDRPQLHRSTASRRRGGPAGRVTLYESAVRRTGRIPAPAQ